MITNYKKYNENILDLMVDKTDEEIKEGFEDFIKSIYDKSKQDLSITVECAKLLVDNGYEFERTDDFSVMWFRIPEKSVYCSMNDYTTLDELKERIAFNKDRWGI